MTNICWNIKGQLISWSSPQVMGILNVNDQSFFDGGKYVEARIAVDRAIEMLEQGAAIIDIGGMSSKPGSIISDPEVELGKVLPVVCGILDKKPQAILSIDTLHASVANECLEAGAAIINDISAATYDPEMLSVLARHRVPVVLMHMKGLPEHMQLQPVYDNIIVEIVDFFIQRLEDCRRSGIVDVIIDPGFGFGKSLAHNFSLLKHLENFQILNKPVLAGLSRKSMIWKTLDSQPGQALNGTTALNMAALMKGAGLLRVHDVPEAIECIRLFQSMNQAD